MSPKLFISIAIESRRLTASSWALADRSAATAVCSAATAERSAASAERSAANTGLSFRALWKARSLDAAASLNAAVLKNERGTGESAGLMKGLAEAEAEVEAEVEAETKAEAKAAWRRTACGVSLDSETTNRCMYLTQVLDQLNALMSLGFLSQLGAGHDEVSGVLGPPGADSVLEFGRDLEHCRSATGQFGEKS